jgi:membrane-associated PAP2 superfamily phosphatase
MAGDGHAARVAPRPVSRPLPNAGRRAALSKLVRSRHDVARPGRWPRARKAWSALCAVACFVAGGLVFAGVIPTSAWLGALLMVVGLVFVLDRIRQAPSGR